MTVLDELAKLKYTFQLRVDYEGQPSPHADRFLQEVAANRDEAVLALAERPFHPPNIRTSEQYRTAIIKGMKDGADTSDLLLLACEAISRMTGDTLFFKMAKERVNHGALP